MSNKPDVYKIFISYSRKDKDIVLPFSAKLEDIFGIKCWIDLQGIAHTEDFTEKIISAIDSCEIFLFMSSKNSMSSEFVKKEVSYALKNGKRIAPVMIDEQPFTNYFQFTLGHLNCINYNDEKDVKKFIADLYSWLKIDNLQNILARCNFVFPLKELSQDALDSIHHLHREMRLSQILQHQHLDFLQRKLPHRFHQLTEYVNQYILVQYLHCHLLISLQQL